MPNLDTANVAYQMIKVLADCAASRADPGRPGAAGAYPHAIGDLPAAFLNMTRGLPQSKPRSEPAASQPTLFRLSQWDRFECLKNLRRNAHNRSALRFCKPHIRSIQ